MTQAAHTAAPWRHAKNSNIGNLVQGPTGVFRYEGDDGYAAICTVQGCCPSQKYADQEANQAANIALICAAPELLAALKAICEFCDDPHGSDKGISLALGMAGLLPAARAAIAKATGSKP